MKRIISFILFFSLLFSVCSVNTSALSVSAKAGVVICGDTGEIIYSKNADTRLPMASTTKIMTGLILCEKADLSKEITVTAEMLRVEGSSMGLLAGDRVTFHDLLYGLMLCSGNDAANVIAFSLSGTVDAFVKQMNEKAKALGLKNTNFVTPSGLDGAEHYTTAYDLALLTREALKNENFAKCVATKTATLCFGNPPYKRTVTNHNKLLGSVDGVIGVKTGFTKKSGRCLVTAARKDEKYVIAVTLNAPNDWQDHKQMLNYGLERLSVVEIKPDNKYCKIPVIGGESEYVCEKTETYTISALDKDGFSAEIMAPQFLYAPIKKGDKIATVLYKSGDRVINQAEITAKTDIKAVKYKQKFSDILVINIKEIFLKIWEI